MHGALFARLSDLESIVSGDGAVSSWEGLLALARPHRLLPVMSWYVRRNSLQVPLKIASALRESEYQAVARREAALAQLREIGEKAQAVGLLMVLVKGPVVASVYPKPWMRLYNDLDFLVPEPAVPLAKDVMAVLGYRPRITGSRASHLPPFYPDGYGFRVEIHTALDREGGVDRFTYEHLKSRLTPWPEVPGLLTLRSVPHFLYLCDHAAGRHLFSNGLLSLFDAHFFTSAWKDEWKEAERLAESWGLARHVGLMLSLEAVLWGRSSATDRFPAPPPEVLDAAVQAVVGTCCQIPSIWRDLPRSDLAGWLSYLGTILSGGPEIRRMSLSERLRFYMSRPWHLVQAHGPTLLSFLIGGRGTREAFSAQKVLTEWIREKA